MAPDEVLLAQWLGRHAVAAWGGTLAVVLGLVATAWRMTRPAAAALAARWSAGRLLATRLLIAAAVATGAAAAFAGLVQSLGGDEGIARFDVALAAALGEHLPPAWLRVFGRLTDLGDNTTLTVLCIAVAALLLWRRQRGLALAWMVAVGGNGLLNRALKSVFERVRPVRLHTVAVAGDGWSFPSGHSSGAVVAYGMLAYLLLHALAPRWRLPLVLLAAAIALTTGISRVLLQVHYASDVLAGFASGTIWLSACISGCEWLRWRSARIGAGRSDPGP